MSKFFGFNRKVNGKRDGVWNLMTPTAKLTAPKCVADKLAKLTKAAR